MTSDIWVFLGSLLRKSKFYQILTRITSTLRDDQYAFLIISRSVLLRMKNHSDKHCREYQHAHFMLNNIFFRKSFRLWDYVEKYCRTVQAIDENMAHVLCMVDTKGYKYTHKGWVILIAFPQQQWFHDRPPLLSCTYIGCPARQAIFNFANSTYRNNCNPIKCPDCNFCMKDNSSANPTVWQ
jgi:hypothetical protein